MGLVFDMEGYFLRTVREDLTLSHELNDTDFDNIARVTAVRFKHVYGGGTAREMFLRSPTYYKKERMDLEIDDLRPPGTILYYKAEKRARAAPEPIWQLYAKSPEASLYKSRKHVL